MNKHGVIFFGLITCVLASGLVNGLASPSDEGTRFPGFVDSQKELKVYLDRYKEKVRTQEAKTRSDDFICVFFYPSSGVDVASFYCYHINANGSLLLYLKAQLPYTAPAAAEIKEDGDFIDVISNGKVVLKISHPQRSDGQRSVKSPS